MTISKFTDTNFVSGPMFDIETFYAESDRLIGSEDDWTSASSYEDCLCIKFSPSDVARKMRQFFGTDFIGDEHIHDSFDSRRLREELMDGTHLLSDIPVKKFERGLRFPKQPKLNCATPRNATIAIAKGLSKIAGWSSKKIKHCIKTLSFSEAEIRELSDLYFEEKVVKPAVARIPFRAEPEGPLAQMIMDRFCNPLMKGLRVIGKSKDLFVNDAMTLGKDIYYYTRMTKDGIKIFQQKYSKGSVLPPAPQETLKGFINGTALQAGILMKAYKILELGFWDEVKLNKQVRNRDKRLAPVETTISDWNDHAVYADRIKHLSKEIRHFSREDLKMRAAMAGWEPERADQLFPVNEISILDLALELKKVTEPNFEDDYFVYGWDRAPYVDENGDAYNSDPEARTTEYDRDDHVVRSFNDEDTFTMDPDDIEDSDIFLTGSDRDDWTYWTMERIRVDRCLEAGNVKSFLALMDQMEFVTDSDSLKDARIKAFKIGMTLSQRGVFWKAYNTIRSRFMQSRQATADSYSGN